MGKKIFFIILSILLLSVGIFVGYSQKNKIDSIIQPAKNYDMSGFDSAPQDKAKTSDDISDSRRNAITRTVALASPAVVGINVTEIRTVRDPFWGDDAFFRLFQFERRAQVKSLGSGFLISKDGYILTNDHVAGNATKIVVTLTNGEKYNAQLVGSDPVSDVALVKIEGENLPSLKLGNSDDILIGEWAIAFGNPFGLFETNDKPTVTVGVISNLNVNIEVGDNQRSYKGMIQTDASINTGNSGGPLLNSIGEVIGINTIIYSPNQGNVGVGFAIPINKVKSIIKDLKEKGKVEREFWTGIEIQEINQSLARHFGLKKSEGVIITDIANRSPGERAGLQVGDIITHINDIKITGESTVFDIIKDAKTGDVLNMKIFRDNKTYDIKLKLEKQR